MSIDSSATCAYNWLPNASHAVLKCSSARLATFVRTLRLLTRQVKLKNVTALSLTQDSSWVREYERIGKVAWPRFMDAEQTSILIYDHIPSIAPTSGVLLNDDGDVLGRFTSVVLELDRATLTDPLPEDGWDWIARRFTTMRPSTQKTTPVACMLELALLPEHRGARWGYRSLLAVLQLLSSCADEALAPVRPNAKSARPDLSFHSYCALTDSSGRPFDPWLRMHVKAGGTVLNIANYSMITTGTRADWATWIGRSPYEITGGLLPPGGLTPLIEVTGTDCLAYIEPNIWIRHNLTRHRVI